MLCDKTNPIIKAINIPTKIDMLINTVLYFVGMSIARRPEKRAKNIEPAIPETHIAFGVASKMIIEYTGNAHKNVIKNLFPIGTLHFELPATTYELES